MAVSTKLSVSALEALERNDVAKLPDGLFTRAFVRSYATEVGLDPDIAAQEFEDRFHDAPARPSDSVARIPAEEIAFEQNKRRMAIAFLLALLVMLIIGAVVVYVVLRDRPQTSTPSEAAGASMVNPAEPSASGTPAAQPSR
jgi:cytoskeleton protein RodZ